MIYTNITKVEICALYVNVSIGEGDDGPYLAVCFYTLRRDRIGVVLKSQVWDTLQ